CVAKLRAQSVFDQFDVVHPDGVVIRQQGANLDADVTSDALLESILDRLQPAVRNRFGSHVFDASDRAKLRTLAAWEAQIDIHERDFARPLLLASQLVGSVGEAL